MESYRQLQDIDPQDRSLKANTKTDTRRPARSLVNGRACRQGTCGLALALLVNVLWWTCLTRPSQISSAGSRLTFSYKTRIPQRVYPQDEKFLLMDYSPWLGFNNMRYMLERGLYVADLLNRTLVIPNHLRIRSCSNPAICTFTATQLNLDTIGHNPQESTMALELGYFFDLETLFKKSCGRVIDFRRFMEDIVGIPERSALVDSEFGAQVAYWNERMRQQNQHRPGFVPEFKATAYTDDEPDGNGEEYEVDGSGDHHPTQLVRVHRDAWNADFLEEHSIVDNVIRNGLVDDFKTHTPISTNTQSPEEHQRVRKTFYAFADVRGGGMDRIVRWSLDFGYILDVDDQEQSSYVLTPFLDGDSCQPPAEDLSVESMPWEARFPSFATCRIDHYVGLRQQLEPIQARFLSIDGQFHTTGWIPVVYSSLENAQRYRDMAFSYLQSTPVIDRATEHLLGNLQTMVMGTHKDSTRIDGDQKPWLQLSIHVRRGDFLISGMGWQEFDDTWMEELVKDAVESVFDKTIDGINSAKGRFYLAKDEVSSQTMSYFRSLGAIVFQDLIDDAFKEEYGYLYAFDDWIGVVEQQICARATRFVGTMSSSFTSGIVNMRMRLGGPLGEKLNYGYLIKPGGPVLTKGQENQ